MQVALMAEKLFSPFLLLMFSSLYWCVCVFKKDFYCTIERPCLLSASFEVQTKTHTLSSSSVPDHRIKPQTFSVPGEIANERCICLFLFLAIHPLLTLKPLPGKSKPFSTSAPDQKDFHHPLHFQRNGWQWRQLLININRSGGFIRQGAGPWFTWVG